MLPRPNSPLGDPCGISVREAAHAVSRATERFAARWKPSAMTSINLQVDIPVQRHRVFELLLDPSRFEDWQPLHESWPHGLPEIAEGRSFIQRTRFMGKSNDITWTVVELRAPSTIVLDGQGAMGLTIRCAYRLSGEGANTTLHVDSGLDGAPLAMRGMVRRGGRAMVAASLADLTALLIGDDPVAVRRRQGDGGLAGALEALARAAAGIALAPLRRAAELARRP